MESPTPLEKYLTTELKVADGLRPSIIGKIQKYDDIYGEFCYWLENRNYDSENPLAIAGYTAKQISELAPRLSGIGVYNFMITLREYPERAKEYIKSGFPTK